MAMALRDRYIVVLGPASIAVHDDGDVPGKVAVLAEFALNADVLGVVIWIQGRGHVNVVT